MIARALTMPLIRPLTQAITAYRPVFAATDPILALFSSGEQGVYYDIQDTSSMFQDAAGTTPAVVGQVVGYVGDKSGNGNHATQNTTASKPILRQNASGNYYLEFDGFDDFLSTASIDFTATDAMTVFAGVRKLSDAALGMLVEFGSSGGAKAFFMAAPRANGVANYSYRSTGSSSSEATSAASYSAPITNVVTGISDISTDVVTLRINGVQAASSTNDQGTGTYDNLPLYIGRRGGSSFSFSGHIYNLTIRGATTDATTISAIETAINAYTGAY